MLDNQCLPLIDKHILIYEEDKMIVYQILSLQSSFEQ